MPEPGLVETFRIVFKEKMAEELARQAKDAGKQTAVGYQAGAGPGLESFFKRIAGWLAGAFAVHKIVSFAKESIKAATESEAAWSELALSLQKVGVNIDENRSRLEKLGKQFLDKTTFGDEAALRGLNTLVQITGDYELSLQAVEVAADLAAAKHLSLEEASTLVGRGLQGNTIMLKRMGVELVQGKGFLEQLRGQFEGFAEKELTTFGGKVKQVALFWGEFREEVGAALIAAGGGTSVLDTLIGTLKGLAIYVGQNKEGIRLIGVGLVQFADVVLKQVIPAIQMVGPWFDKFANEFLAGTTRELILFLKAWAGFNRAMSPLSGGASDAAASVLEEWIAKFEAMGKAAREAAIEATETIRVIRAGGGSTAQGGGGSRGSAIGLGDTPEWRAAEQAKHDRIVKNIEAEKKAELDAIAEKKRADENLQDALYDAHQFMLGLADELDTKWKTMNTARLLEIRTEGEARKKAMEDTALKILEIAGEEAARNQAERDEEEDKRDAAKRKAQEDQRALASTIFDVGDAILAAGDAWGVFEGKAGQALRNTLSSVVSLAGAIAQGDIFGSIMAGIGLISNFESLLGSGGESPAQRSLRIAIEKNELALRDNTKVLQIGTTAARGQAAKSALGGFLEANAGIGGTNVRFDADTLDLALRKSGTSLQELQAIANSLGIDISHLSLVELQQLQEHIEGVDLAAIKAAEAAEALAKSMAEAADKLHQLETLQSQRAGLADADSPLAQARLRAGADVWIPALQNILTQNLGTEMGRAAADAMIKQQFEGADKLTVAQRGGLSVEDFRALLAEWETSIDNIRAVAEQEAADRKQGLLDQRRQSEVEQVAARQAKEDQDAFAALRRRGGVVGGAAQAAVEQAARMIAEAVALAGGPLGPDSPLAQDARRRADLARSAAEQLVSEAERARNLEANGTLTPGYSVTRTLTETSANRVVGELITSNVWLERIYNRMGVGAGLTTGGGTPGIMADRYSTQALLAGNPEIPN